MVLTVNRVSYSYPGAAQPALSNVTATFPAGWTGLVGDNGCGKTTLAHIACGLIMPDEGTVSPARLFSSYCPQDSSVRPNALDDFASDWSRDAIELRALLGIEDDWPWRFETLSGGQQKRLQIACCLWSRPDLLVLDEPTNNLDAPSRRAVARTLPAFKGIGLLISHDRDLLDSIAGQCLVFENGAAIMRPGGYSKAMAAARNERTAALRNRQQARAEADRLRKEAARRNQEAQRSKSRLSARSVDKRDSDARERLGRAKMSGKDAVAGRASAAMASRLSAAESKLAATEVSKRYDYQFELVGARAASKTVCHLEAGVLRRSDFSLEIPELWVAPADHIAIMGENGAGKSTLVSHLLGRVPNTVRTAFVPQDVDAEQRARALAQLAACTPKDRGRILSHVARLNSDPARIVDGEDVSPGEMRKLILAELLLAEPNLLVLDEPTNHLDVASIEALQGLLCAFKGAVVLVSHDEALVRESCTTRWQLERVGEAGGSFALRAS